MDQRDDRTTVKRQEGEAAEGATAQVILLQLASHGDILRMILGILQAGSEQDGPGLQGSLDALVKQIGEQTQQLKQIGVALAKLGRDLPLDLVAAIDDNLDIPRRTESNGHANGNGSFPS